MRAVNPNLYGASWYGATQIATPPRDPLTTELDVDVCVVGAGLAGLTVAREVARRGWSVVVLESHSVAWNASGRNTGFVLPGFAADPEALELNGFFHRFKVPASVSAAWFPEFAREPIRQTFTHAVTQIRDVLDGAFLVGAVPSFDATMLTHLLHAYDLKPA